MSKKSKNAKVTVVLEDGTSEEKIQQRNVAMPIGELVLDFPNSIDMTKPTFMPSFDDIADAAKEQVIAGK